MKQTRNDAAPYVMWCCSVNNDMAMLSNWAITPRKATLTSRQTIKATTSGRSGAGGGGSASDGRSWFECVSAGGSRGGGGWSRWMECSRRTESRLATTTSYAGVREAVERDERKWAVPRDESEQAAGAREDGKADKMDGGGVGKVVGAEARGDDFGEVSAAQAHSGRAEIDDDAKVFLLLRHPQIPLQPLPPLPDNSSLLFLFTFLYPSSSTLHHSPFSRHPSNTHCKPHPNRATLLP